jgi:hypothetical protein
MTRYRVTPLVACIAFVSFAAMTGCGGKTQRPRVSPAPAPGLTDSASASSSADSSTPDASLSSADAPAPGATARGHAPAEPPRPPDSTFDDGLAGWGALWTRDQGVGSVSHDRTAAHSGAGSARIEHGGRQDWSFAFARRERVRYGDLFEITAWVKVEGEGDATLCATLRDAGGEVIDWVFAGRTARGTADWTRLRSRFAVPAGVAEVEARLIGRGAATVWFDDFTFAREGNVMDRVGSSGGALALKSERLSVVVHPGTSTITVTDRRSGRVWKQLPFSTAAVLRAAKRAADGSIELRLADIASDLDMAAKLSLDEDAPELVVEITADEPDGALAAPVAFPPAFAPVEGTYLVVPMNEGISYPVEDGTIEPMRLVAYGGHGICMAFWGVTDGEAGYGAIIETPDDAAFRMDRRDGMLAGGVEWDPQKGRFGYARRVRYVFFDRGGHVAICKRYRAHARKTGLLKTFTEKRFKNPAIDMLAGAVNIWCWEDDALRIADELRAAGIERILWSNRAPPDTIRAMNARGILTSRYDIYQDVMDPSVFDRLSWIHPDWPTAAWPNDLVIRADGSPQPGWEVETKDGGMYPCGVLCDARAPRYVRERIANELQTHPYRCRFIDTTTASPWRECYAEAHPMTRSDSRRHKMNLLEIVSREMGLVCGCETGHDAAVPYVDYFEGMLSLGPYRIPDAGRAMAKIWDDVPESVATFQVGHRYRLPLWELVYHDCVVAQWYWGDYNNKLPALWRKRDRFNALYGTPPMFMFSAEFWKAHKDRFVESYRATSPVARATFYSEMTDHRLLTPDRAVQQTRFANGVIVTVNFGEDAWSSQGMRLEGGECRVEGIDEGP